MRSSRSAPVSLSSSYLFLDPFSISMTARKSSGCILAAGRVAGESAVLMYTAGLSTVMQDFSTIEGLMKASGSTLTVALYVYAKERADFAAAFAVAAVLLMLAALLNLAAGMTAGKVKERKGTCRLWQKKRSSARRS